MKYHGITKSLTEKLESLDDLLKGKSLPIGTLRTWGGVDYVKHGDGWVAVHSGKVTQGKKMEEVHNHPNAAQHEEHAKPHRKPKESKGSKEAKVAEGLADAHQQMAQTEKQIKEQGKNKDLKETAKTLDSGIKEMSKTSVKDSLKFIPKYPDVAVFDSSEGEIKVSKRGDKFYAEVDNSFDLYRDNWEEMSNFISKYKGKLVGQDGSDDAGPSSETKPTKAPEKSQSPSKPTEPTSKKSKNKNFEFTSDFSPEEIDAIKEYQNGMYGSKLGGFSVIQSVLRTGTHKEGDKISEKDKQNITEIANQISSAIKKSKVTSDIKVYRGIRATGSLKDLKVGQVLSEKGFTSTSLDKSISKKFSQKLNSGEIPTVFEISVRRGQNALFMNDVSRHDSEKEVVLDKDSMFKVESVSESGNSRTVKVTLMDIDDHVKKGGEGSGVQGHITNRLEDSNLKVANLTAKLQETNPAKDHLRKLTDGAVMENQKLRSGKPLFLKPEQGVAHGYTPEEHREAASAHYDKMEATSKILDKYKELGKPAPPEFKEIMQFHRQAYKGFTNAADTVERRTKDTDHAIKERRKQAVAKSTVMIGHNDAASINTADYAIDREASLENEWLGKLQSLMAGYQYGDTPRMIAMDKGNLYLVQVDGGIYTGVFKTITGGEYESSPEAMVDNAKVRIERMTLPSIVQFCLAKEWIGNIKELPTINQVGITYAAAMDYASGQIAQQGQDQELKVLQNFVAQKLSHKEPCPGCEVCQPAPSFRDVASIERRIKMLELLDKLLN
jgi:hypothetical protein